MALNPMLKVGGAVALFATVTRILAMLWAGAPAVVTFVSQNASFFYGLGAGIAVAGFTKSFWAVIIAIAAVFLLLKYVGW